MLTERMPSMHCIHCGALLPENAKFCTSCGKPVHVAPVVPEEPAAPVQPEEGNVFEPETPNAAPGSVQLPASYSNPVYSSQATPTGTVPEKSVTNGLAIAGFVCSLIVFPFAIGTLCAIVGLVLSIMGLNNAKKLPDRKGYGLSVAGIILCSIHLAVVLIIVVAAFTAMLRGLGELGRELINNWPQYMPYTY